MSKLIRKNGDSLLAHDPFRIDGLFQDIFGYGSIRPNRSLNLFDRMFNEDFINIARHPVIVKKTEDGGITLSMDVPGCDKKDLDISLNEDTGILSVSSNTEEKTDSVLERRSFSYQYRLNDYDLNTLEATCEKGVLLIRAAPLIKKKNIRTIEIK